MNRWLQGIAASFVLAAGGAFWHLSRETTQVQEKVTSLEANVKQKVESLEHGIRQRVENVEERAKEDRRDARQSLHEVKDHIKLIDQNVQIILQEVRAMKAVQESERRRGNKNG